MYSLHHGYAFYFCMKVQKKKSFHLHTFCERFACSLTGYFAGSGQINCSCFKMAISTNSVKQDNREVTTTICPAR